MTHDLSLGELQALCFKAARGAGRAVGVAEDAGRAVRWLHARDYNGARALVQLLTATDGLIPADMVPVLPALTPAKQAICPLALGGYLSDTNTVPNTPMGPVWTPILMLPFLDDGTDIDAASTDPAMVQLKPRTIPRTPSHSRAQVSVQTMDSLLAFAARTYAPATDESRASGAGSGLSDND